MATDAAAGGHSMLERRWCSSKQQRRGCVSGARCDVAAVPWARHGARHTREFDDQVAWLVTHTSKTAVVELMRVTWRTVGAIGARVVADSRAARDPFDALVRIGIYEISYRRGHKYLMVVVDHDTGRLVWAAEGHDRKTLQKFFDLLGTERANNIKLVSADAAEWIGDCAMANCVNAELCLDPFHTVRWTTNALDVGAPRHLEHAAATPTTTSPFASSSEAATAHPYPTDNTPHDSRKQPESRKIGALYRNVMSAPQTVGRLRNRSAV